MTVALHAEVLAAGWLSYPCLLKQPCFCYQPGHKQWKLDPKLPAVTTEAAGGREDSEGKTEPHYRECEHQRGRPPLEGIKPLETVE